MSDIMRQEVAAIARRVRRSADGSYFVRLEEETLSFGGDYDIDRVADHYDVGIDLTYDEDENGQAEVGSVSGLVTGSVENVVDVALTLSSLYPAILTERDAVLAAVER